MTIEVVRGDLFDAEVDVIAHGCNTRGVMGAGIAAAFRHKFPAMYQQYRAFCQSGLFATGSVFKYEITNNPHEANQPFHAIFNLGTQEYPGPDAKISHIEECFERIRYYYNVPMVIGIPFIGCGIGSLNWDDVKLAIENVIEGSNLTVKAYYL